MCREDGDVGRVGEGRWRGVGGEGVGGMGRVLMVCCFDDMCIGYAVRYGLMKGENAACRTRFYLRFFLPSPLRLLPALLASEITLALRLCTAAAAE